MAVMQMGSEHLLGNMCGGTTESAIMLALRYQKEDTKHTFYVADLGEDHMILGMPFLAATNPDIDWSQLQSKGCYRLC